MWKTFDYKSKKPGKKGEVLNKDIYRCGFCSGRGFAPSKKSTQCPACLGAGTIKVKSPAVICAYCNGEGRSFLNRDLTCIICKGKGVVPIESREIQICNVCKGMGRERGSSLPCLKCKGKGVILLEKKDKASENNLEESFNTENNP